MQDLESESKSEKKSAQETWPDMPIVYVYEGENSGSVKADTQTRDQASGPSVKMDPKWTVINDNIFTLRNKIDSLFQNIQVKYLFSKVFLGFLVLSDF